MFVRFSIILLFFILMTKYQLRTVSIILFECLFGGRNVNTPRFLIYDGRLLIFHAFFDHQRLLGPLIY